MTIVLPCAGEPATVGLTATDEAEQQEQWQRQWRWQQQWQRQRQRQQQRQCQERRQQRQRAIFWVAAGPKTIQVCARVMRSVPTILKVWCHRLAIAAVLVAGPAIAYSGCASWAGVPGNMQQANRDFPPYRVAGNIYYVGSNDIALFLITTSRGHILIDSGFEASVPRLRENIEQLGFRYQDIKFLLTSHAHIDHVQAHALVRQQTGAQVVVSTADAPFVEQGGKGETVFDGVFSWTPCPVDRRVNDGDSVTLGETKLVAHLTPGHTLGATTWTMQLRDGEESLDVVFFPSANVNRGVTLLNNQRYPNIARDFARSFSVWKALECDLFLADHGEFYEMKEKFARLQRGEQPNPFIDPEGYRRFLAGAEARFREQLESER